MPAPDDECPHGMGDPAWCTLCNGRDAREAQLAASMRITRAPGSYPLNARFPGTCAVCAHGYLRGALIVKTQADRWAHAACTSP